jgi:hypothetical protein
MGLMSQFTDTPRLLLSQSVVISGPKVCQDLLTRLHRLGNNSLTEIRQMGPGRNLT